MALPHQVAQGCPGDARQVGDGRAAQQQMAAPDCHTHPQRGGLGGGQGDDLVAGPPGLPRLPVSPPSLPSWTCPLPAKLESFLQPLIY